MSEVALCYTCQKPVTNGQKEFRFDEKDFCKQKCRGKYKDTWHAERDKKLLAASAPAVKIANTTTVEPTTRKVKKDDTKKTKRKPKKSESNSEPEGPHQDPRDLADDYDHDQCPVCKGKRVKQCKCFRSDSVCENNHKWYYLKTRTGRRIVVGTTAHADENPDEDPDYEVEK